jgi:hypothetical protein
MYEMRLPVGPATSRNLGISILYIGNRLPIYEKCVLTSGQISILHGEKEQPPCMKTDWTWGSSNKSKSSEFSLFIRWGTGAVPHVEQKLDWPVGRCSNFVPNFFVPNRLVYNRLFSFVPQVGNLRTFSRPRL